MTADQNQTVRDTLERGLQVLANTTDPLQRARLRSLLSELGQEWNKSKS